MENKNKIKLQSLKEKITTKLDGKMGCLEDNYTCRLCGYDNKNVIIHIYHIKNI